MDEHVRNKITRFFEKYPRVIIKAGEPLIQAGVQPTHIFYMISGQVKQTDISNRGFELVLNVFHPPSFFPITWSLNKSHNIYTYTAVTDVTARRAPVDDVLAWLKSEPEVMLDLLMRLQSGLEGVLRRMSYAMSGTAQEKLILEIITSGERFGRPEGKGFVLQISINDLAARCGVARETASRELALLKKQSLLTTNRGQITVPNKVLLAELLV